MWLAHGVFTGLPKKWVLNHPDLSGGLDQVCLVSQESELNMQKQRSGFMHQIIGTSPQNPAGPLQLLVFLNQSLKLSCLLLPFIKPNNYIMLHYNFYSCVLYSILASILAFIISLFLFSNL